LTEQLELQEAQATELTQQFAEEADEAEARVAAYEGLFSQLSL